MVPDKKHTSKPPKGDEDSPAWADGLKQLYDSVVDEPLPDTFKDLLSQLDDSEGEANGSGSKGAGA